MNILAIDTSTNVATVSLQVENTLYTQNINDTQTHSQKLLPLITEILNNHNLKIKDIDKYICGNGPGSFTGIRIGASTVKALAQVTNKKIFGVSTLDALAYNEVIPNKYICSLIDARNNNAYYCIYKANEDNTITYLSAHSTASIEEIVEKLNELPEKPTIVGSGAIAYKEILLQNNYTISENNEVSAEKLILMYNSFDKVDKEFIEKNTFTCHSFKPIYLRPSQAERLKK